MNAYTALAFDDIRRMLGELACTQGARERLGALAPTLSQAENQAALRSTGEARALLEALGTPPLSSMDEMDKVLPLLQAGGLLSPTELLSVTRFLASCRRMKGYLRRGLALRAELALMEQALSDLPELTAEIERCIRGDAVDSHASARLASLRDRVEATRGQIRSRLNALLAKNKKWFSDTLVVTRGDRLALPVRKEYRSQVPGTVLDMSASGSTCFIEPSAVGKLQDELRALQMEEENEVRRILYTLSAMAQDAEPTIDANRKTLEQLDFAFAKGKLSLAMHATAPEITLERDLVLREARHPLLPAEGCVPLSLRLDASERGIVITGPNTGGKTVALKTVGLLVLMGQSGLHVPAAHATLPMCSEVLCDIGDGQSISENLSTFSAHMTNILDILRRAGGQSLVLLDELGSGTDPMEGMGIAVAVLDALRERQCLLIATTHYPEVKTYAATAPGLRNARMAFDRESLAPLYRLEVGEAGESCALYIAKRLGFPEPMLRRAYQEAYRGGQRQAAPPPEDLFDGAGAADLPRAAGPRIRPAQQARQQSAHALSFQLGDSVYVHPGRRVGLVYAPANERGEIGVQIQGVKQRVPHKRVQLHVPASELYPEDYDFSIVFDSVENRKARHQLDKGHRPDAQVVYEKGELE